MAELVDAPIVEVGVDIGKKRTRVVNVGLYGMRNHNDPLVAGLTNM